MSRNSYSTSIMNENRSYLYARESIIYGNMINIPSIIASMQDKGTGSINDHKKISELVDIQESLINRNQIIIKDSLLDDNITLELDSVKRKRHKKMKKHKLRKRRKREKAEKRKQSQGR